MPSRTSKVAYARFDPGHLIDGLFVPTNGKRRNALLVPPRRFGAVEIGFEGREQLGADDQSIFLALVAQLGIGGDRIDGCPTGQVSKSLRADLKLGSGDEREIAAKKTSLRSLRSDAGYSEYDGGRSIKNTREILHRLRSTQMREIDLTTGWDRSSNLISANFNRKTGEVYVAANPRLTMAIFNGQHVRVSLMERNALTSDVAKLLHCWLCSHIRPGQSLGNGRGAYLDTLAPHLWGEEGWEMGSTALKSKRRKLLGEALGEIDGSPSGWVVRESTNGVVRISRPKSLPDRPLFGDFIE